MSHTEFGRRSEGFTREGLRNLQGVHFERTDEGEIHEAAARLRRTAFWIGAGALLIGIYVGTKSSGRDLNFWRKDPGPVAAQPYVPIGVRDVTQERINSTCTARGDSAGRGNVVRQAAAYVICLSTETPRRLCQATHRTHFLAATTNYYRRRAPRPGHDRCRAAARCRRGRQRRPRGVHAQCRTGPIRLLGRAINNGQGRLR
jgi:hypothetical protein